MDATPEPKLVSSPLFKFDEQAQVNQPIIPTLNLDLTKDIETPSFSFDSFSEPANPPTTPLFSFGSFSEPANPPTTPSFSFGSFSDTAEPPTTPKFDFGLDKVSPAPAFTFGSFDIPKRAVSTLPEFTFDTTQNSSQPGDKPICTFKSENDDLDETDTPTSFPVFKPYVKCQEEKENVATNSNNCFTPLKPADQKEINQIPYLDLSITKPYSTPEKYYPGCLLDPSKTYWENPAFNNWICTTTTQKDTIDTASSNTQKSSSIQQNKETLCNNTDLTVATDDPLEGIFDDIVMKDTDTSWDDLKPETTWGNQEERVYNVITKKESSQNTHSKAIKSPPENIKHWLRSSDYDDNTQQSLGLRDIQIATQTRSEQEEEVTTKDNIKNTCVKNHTDRHPYTTTCVKKHTDRNSYTTTCVKKKADRYSYATTCVKKHTDRNSYATTCVKKHTDRNSYATTCVKKHTDQNPYTKEVYYQETRPNLLNKITLDIPEQLKEIDCPDCGEKMYVPKEHIRELCGLCKIEYTLQIQHWYRVNKIRKLVWRLIKEVDLRSQNKKQAAILIQRNYRHHLESEKARLVTEGDFVLVDVDDL